MFFKVIPPASFHESRFFEKKVHPRTDHSFHRKSHFGPRKSCFGSSGVREHPVGNQRSMACVFITGNPYRLKSFYAIVFTCVRI